MHKLIFPFTPDIVRTGTLNKYFSPRTYPLGNTYGSDRVFGNDPANSTELEIVLNDQLTRVELLLKEASNPRNFQDLYSRIVFEAYDVYGNKLASLPAYTPEFGVQTKFVFAYNPDVLLIPGNERTNSGDYRVTAPIKKVIIKIPKDSVSAVMALAAGEAVVQGPTWKNGVTRTIDPGIPPADWYLSPDTWWYPVISAPPTDPPIDEPEIPEVPVEEPPITPQAPTSFVGFKVRIITASQLTTKWTSLKVRMSVSPAGSDAAPLQISSTAALKITPIALPLKRAFMDEIRSLLKDKIDTYFDRTRAGKTLVNFDNDEQIPVVNWKYSNTSPANDVFLLKLYKPLPTKFEDRPFIVSRELAYPLLDLVFLVDASAPAKIYLRPANNKISVTGQYGKLRTNVTLQEVLDDSAYDELQPSDRVSERWYTTGLEGSELNVDYSNYHNFVFYSSAVRRLEAFKNKLLQLEGINEAIQINSSSFSGLTGSAHISTSFVYGTVYDLNEQRQSLLRSFDPYEQFLYYETEKPFSGSFRVSQFTSVDDIAFDQPDTTWPKISGSIAPIASATFWYESQLEIADVYDNWNVNRFANNIPTYLIEDYESQDFVKFLDMVGHMFDTSKLYADNMTSIYDRNSDPNVGMSKDLVWSIAKSFGFNLPNQYSLNSLYSYTIATGSKEAYRTSAAETWKRFLHNQIYLLKTKGTKTSLRGLLNTFGVLPTTVQIRESTTPSYFYSTQSYETIEENTNTLNMESGSFVSIPWSTLGNDPVSIEMRFSPVIESSTQVLFQSDNDWSVLLIPTGTAHKLAISVGSLVTAETPPVELTADSYYSMMLQYSADSSSIYFKQSDDDGDLIVNYSASETSSLGLSSVWTDGGTLYLGASGSTFGNPFKGEIDEFRVWGETITEEGFDRWVKYPALYNGNTPESSRDSLWVRLSFNKPKNLGGALFTDALLPNESPYQRLATAPAQAAFFSASFFENEQDYPYSFTTKTRTIQRLSPTAGGSQFDSNKIIIEDEPVLKYFSGSSVPVLSRDQSIVTYTQRNEEDSYPNNLIGFYFSPTEAINDSIIRSIGNIDLHDYIGDPRDQYKSTYPLLQELNELYWTYYAYSMNINQFLDFVKDILNPLFDQAEKLVPARAKLLTGLVIEPHILERNKIPLKPLVREPSNNFEASSMTGLPFMPVADIDMFDGLVEIVDDTVLTGTVDDLSTFIEHLSVAEIVSVYSPLETVLREDSTFESNASIDLYDSSIVLGSGNPIVGSYIDLSTVINFSEEVYSRAALVYKNALDAGTIYSDDSLIPTYYPYADIDTDIGARTFFTDPDGYIGVESYVKVRKKENILSNEGTWVRGGVYTANDMVLQLGLTDVSDTPGNGREFYAITDNFVSNKSPYLDRANWRPVSYVYQKSLEVKKVVDISGSLSLVATSSLLDPFIGYRPNHYKFFKSTETGYNNARYRGCVQTAETTTDGGPAVVVADSAGDELYVKGRSGTPVIPPRDASGPILDVR